MEEYNLFIDGIAEQKTKIVSAINEHGFYLHQDDSCFYTVGMSSIGFPELLMFDPSFESVNEIISDIYCCIKKDKIGSIRDFIENNPFSRVVGFEPLPEATKRNLLWSTRLFLGNWNFEVAKLKSH
jgi:hypothetical protein